MKRREIFGAWYALFAASASSASAKPSISKNSTPSEASEFARLESEAMRDPSTGARQTPASPPDPLE